MPRLTLTGFQDYDCFYASVFEAENPALRSLPLAVQQKHIIVTCNYEARRRGLRKLQLISEARQSCPDVVIVLGENLDRFRDASKDLYSYLEAFTWNRKVERLGFDEVFMDVTDIVEYNHALLNFHDPANSFFQLSRDDPTAGFSFDASRVAGHQYPDVKSRSHDLLSLNSTSDLGLLTRLILGSHLAQHLRHLLEEEKGYTSTVGISTTKLLAKLVGNLHKPKGQTTLMPPYECDSKNAEHSKLSTSLLTSNVTAFIDSHEIGKIPGIGFKMAHKIRNHIESRQTAFDGSLAYTGNFESINVHEVRTHPGMGPQSLEKLLGGPGAERGIGGKVWDLINGVDDTEVREAKKIPTQLSIEDSYTRLDTISQVQIELRLLATTLLRRMRVDLLEDDEEDSSGVTKRWLAHPKTLRLSTRPRPPPNPDGTRARSHNRISRSAPMPNFFFSLREAPEILVEKLVQEILLPMFHRLHPEKHWNLSLVNIAVTNMVEAASEDGSGGGRDISRMFKRQKDVLKEWKVEDKDVPPDVLSVGVGDTSIPTENSDVARAGLAEAVSVGGSEDMIWTTQHSMASSDRWDDEDGGFDEDNEQGSESCGICGAVMPAFAMAAHERYHDLGD